MFFDGQNPAIGIMNEWKPAMVLVRSVGMVFFFQAEDGIRDVAVTGVQTCALPIWLPSAYSLFDGNVANIALRKICQRFHFFKGSPGRRSERSHLLFEFRRSVATST